VCILPEKAVPEMTYIVSGGTLNPTHSFTICADICTRLMHGVKVSHISLCYHLKSYILLLFDENADN